MCGIVGLFHFDSKSADPDLLKRMSDRLTHRGPDAEGFFHKGAVGLGMRRLKVIDLESGNQPMHDSKNQVHIVFNGEIYNYCQLRARLEKNGHRFQTKSDTEVILNAYLDKGEAALQSFNGMFAFAIYDESKDALFIARDRLGIKPLFFHQGSHGVAFASEIKALLEVPWVPQELNLEAVHHFLSYNYLPPPWTPLNEIQQLLPGHWMKIQGGKVEVARYWDVPVDEVVDEDEATALKKIERLLHRSVERRLIADVPLGAFLSGGLDSSILVALMKEQKHGKIKTFSAGFEDASYDETPHAREVAKAFETDHHEILCRAEDVPKLLPKIAWHADNPLADQATLPLYQVSKLAREHVTVCLSGDGGDEVFVGYETFHANRYHETYSKLPAFLRHRLIEPLIRSLPASTDKVSFEYKAKRFIEAGNFPSTKAHFWWRTIFTDLEKQSLFHRAIARKFTESSFVLYEAAFEQARHLPMGQRALYADMKVWLVGNNLHKVDSMSMAHSLEARVPFLDHELVEYMARLPFALKYKGNVLKYLLKKSMGAKLPAAILKRRKSGFHSPIASWFRGPLNEYAKDVLLSQNPLFGSLFEKKKLAELIENHRLGRQNNSFKIWGLMVLHHWCDEFLSKHAPVGTDSQPGFRPYEPAN